jgi:hypothetical protein
MVFAYFGKFLVLARVDHAVKDDEYVDTYFDEVFNDVDAIQLKNAPKFDDFFNNDC